jgi:hypothetical protein
LRAIKAQSIQLVMRVIRDAFVMSAPTFVYRNLGLWKTAESSAMKFD